MNRLGVLGHMHRLVKGEQGEEDNKRVIRKDQRIKETQNKGHNTRFVWSPQLLSATPLGSASGTSHDLHVDQLMVRGVCMRMNPSKGMMSVVLLGHASEKR